MTNHFKSRVGRWSAVASVIALSLVGCRSQPSESAAAGGSGASPTPEAEAMPRAGCDQGDGGIKLPAGFCASVFADNLGRARHLAVSPNGDVYVNTWSSQYNEMTNQPGGYVVALRDANRDGHAETIQRFGTVHQNGKPGGGTGIAVHGGALYIEVDDRIVRYALTPDSIAPKGEPTVVISGLPQEGDHPMHPFAIASDGAMFMNSGSASNACQEKNRAIGSRGIKPCRELSTRAGIWRYDANKSDQTFSPAERYATGARNVVALAIQPADGALYATIHGRDQLSENWPRLYTDAQNNELPAEVLVRIDQGSDVGWPYCYYDGAQSKYVLAPEYGGNGGKAVGDCASKTRPGVTFPAHWSPDGMAFYSGSTFPTSYRGGAFVAFHGSWNRKPTQAGFLVAFVPFSDAQPTGRFEEFATGFAGAQLPAEPKQAAHRPVGVAVGPDGALYVADDLKGRIWRITYMRQ